MHFLHIANSDKPVKFFSLDVIISVGYRVKSVRGTQFRQWANKILKESNIEIIKSPKGVEVVRRNINNKEKYFVMNHTDKTQQLGDKTIKPYEAFITDHI